jgi:hypothetical protein
MKSCAQIFRFNERRFSTPDDIQEALFAVVEDQKTGNISSDEAREIQYQLTNMLFTSAGEKLNDQLPDSPLTVRGSLNLSALRTSRVTGSARGSQSRSSASLRFRDCVPSWPPDVTIGRADFSSNMRIPPAAALDDMVIDVRQITPSEVALDLRNDRSEEYTVLLNVAPSLQARIIVQIAQRRGMRLRDVGELPIS